jgi:cell division protein FtsB
MFKNLSPRMKMIWASVAIVLVVLAVLGKSFYSLAHNKQETYRLQARESFLDQDYERLETELSNLREQDPATMERIARTQYNMVKKDEIQFRFAENDTH